MEIPADFVCLAKPRMAASIFGVQPLRWGAWSGEVQFDFNAQGWTLFLHHPLNQHYRDRCGWKFDSIIKGMFDAGGDSWTAVGWGNL